jgi:hypothetical protein
MLHEEALPPVIAGFQHRSGQSPEDMGSQAEPGNQEQSIKPGTDLTKPRSVAPSYGFGI